MSDTRPQIYIHNLREALGNLGDIDHQRRVWLPNTPGKMDSFEEAWCAACDDSGLGDALDRDRAEEVLTAAATERLRALDSLLRKVNVDQSVELLIASEEMERVRLVAREVLDLIPPD